MGHNSAVKIELFRWAGSFWPFKIKQTCSECDMVYHSLKRLMETELADRPVSLTVQPWLDNWYKIFHKGAWHPPIIFVNGRVFSQGVIPDTGKLLAHVGLALRDKELLFAANKYRRKTQSRHLKIYKKHDNIIPV